MTAAPLRLLLATLVLGVASATSVAQDRPDPAPAGEPPAASVESGRIPVRVIAGRLVTSCDVSTRFRRLPVNLFVDLEDPCGLQLHNRAAGPGALEAESDADRGSAGFHPITLHFPGLKITVPGREHGPEDVYEEFTKYHSTELGENALVGTIGSGVLSRYHLTLDLDAGSLFVAPPHAVGAETDASAGGETIPVTVANGVVFVPATLPDGRTTAFGIGTKRWDSIVDQVWCDRAGHPAGDVGPVRLGGIDISRYVALRPDEIRFVHADGVIGFLGLGLLQHFRVEIDRANRRVTFTESAPPKFPESDLAFFRALVEDAPGPLLTFLDEYPGERTSPEAAERLLDLLLANGSEPDEFARAVDWFDKTRPEDLRTTAALDLVKELEQGGHTDEIVAVAEKGIASGRKDRYPNAVHEVHARLGAVLLERGEAEGERAWKHLLSAAFGLPEDGMVNLNLGRWYERQGRLQRAFSRYVQASIKPESGPQALEGLARVQAALGGAPLDVDEIEKLIEGKVLNYSAATEFEETPENTTDRVVLVEWFTNAHLEQGGLGGALGNEALVTHFPRSRVAVLAHHIESPALEPLVNETSAASAAFYGVDGPVVHRIDGVIAAPGAARTRDKEKLFERLREVVGKELMRPTAYRIALTATVEDGVVKGTVNVTGPPSDDLRLHVVLAERGVLFPGRSGVVVHRYVARGVLTRGLDGERWRPVDGALELAFSRSLEGVRVANEAWLDERQGAGAGTAVKVSTRIDPRQVSVVAYLRNAVTHEVVQAAQFDPFPPEDEEQR